MAEVGAPISLDGVASIRIIGASACVIFTLHQKTQTMANKDTIVGITPWVPHMPMQIGSGETQPKCRQLCARVHGCVNDDLRAYGLWKGWGFWVSTWNVDSLTGRAGEVVEELVEKLIWHAFKKDTAKRLRQVN